MTNSTLASIDETLIRYAKGEFIIIVDDEDRENEGDLAIAADFITAESVNFMATHGKGLICLAMHGSLLDRLQIPLMIPQEQNRSGFGTAFTVSIEAAKGVSTGISAEDRAQTIKVLIDPATTAADIAMPGHMFPLRASDNGVLERRGQTEASVDMSILASLSPASSICELMSGDGTMMRLPEIHEFAVKHDIPIISVEALAQYRAALETKATVKAKVVADTDVGLIGKSVLPTEHGIFDIQVFRDAQGFEHSTLSIQKDKDATALVRIHSECLTGDAFGSLRCDCGEQLQSSLKMIAEHGSGALVYLRQEGRGIGLGNKIRAYALQDEGLDTVDANHQLGFPTDARSYDVAATILGHLNINELSLITNNPEKVAAMQAAGIKVASQIPLIIAEQPYNASYLNTKANRLGHQLKLSS
ncbi:MAG: 3,4-dihydroxy-2-butanone-4-phosphate synthase [Granulosicoccaceae bacterium]